MFEVDLKLAFSGGESLPREFETKEEFQEARNEDAERRFWQHLLQEVKREPIFGRYYDELPDISNVVDVPGKQSLSLNGFEIEQYFNWRNTYHAWTEIQNLLISTKYNLTEARAYKALELDPAESNNEMKIPYNLHIKKMDCFKLATQNMIRIEDLVLLLVFENLGASLIKVDFKKRDWQKYVTWKNLLGALKKQRKSHKELKALSEEEYQSLMKILRAFKNPNFVKEFIEFRDCMTHRFSPSVDYPELYFSPERRVSKVVKTPSGQTRTEWPIFARPSKPDYEFLKLYELAAKTFAHWVSLLARLRTITRFNPDTSMSYP